MTPTEKQHPCPHCSTETMEVRHFLDCPSLLGAHPSAQAPPVDPEAPAPAPLAWAVQMKGIPDIWSTFPAEKYARQQLQEGLQSGSLGGYESDWEIFPIYRASPMGLDPAHEANLRNLLAHVFGGKATKMSIGERIQAMLKGEGSPPDTAPALLQRFGNACRTLCMTSFTPNLPISAHQDAEREYLESHAALLAAMPRSQPAAARSGETGEGRDK